MIKITGILGYIFGIFFFLSLSWADEETPKPFMQIEELEAFLDDFWETNGERRQTPGMIFSLVRDGIFVVSRGYGLGNTTTGTNVDPDQTVFRIGSVSKIFVGIAAAQLIEKGQLDPFRDINTYLDFEIIYPFGTPITIDQLLTHSAGIDDVYFADTSRTLVDQESLGDHLKNRLPAQVFQSGTYISYSNYGYALAAYVIERVSGIAFSQYVKENILFPLGMTQSGFILTDDLQKNLATGYALKNRILAPQPYTYTHRYPSTTMMTTASDMAKLTAALLNNGCLAEVCILGEAGHRLVFKNQKTQQFSLPGRTYGFSEWVRQDYRGIWHDGGTAGFAAEFFLFPELGIGFFIADNRQSSGLSQSLKMALLDRFFNKEQETPLRPAINNPNSDQFVGSYAAVRRNWSTAEKLRLLRQGVTQIAAGSEGTIRIFGRRYQQVAPLTFQWIDDDHRSVVFGTDSEGKVSHFFIDGGGMIANFERLRFVDRPVVFYSVAGYALFVFLLGSIFWGIKNRRNSNGQFKAIFLSTLGFSLLNWGFVSGIAFYMVTVNAMVFRFGEANLLYVILALPLLSIPLGLYNFWQMGISFRKPGFYGEKLIYFLTSLGILFLYYFYYQWNLIGFQL